MRKTTFLAGSACSFTVAAALLVATAGLAHAAITEPAMVPKAQTAPGQFPPPGCGAFSWIPGNPAGCDTIVTFTVGTAPLSISVPETARLSFALPGETARGALGPITVTDDRAATDASWTVWVTSSDFTTADGDVPAETISAADVGYWSGPAVATHGSGTFRPGEPTSADAVPLDTPELAFSHMGGMGSNSATWDPTVDVAVPGGVVAGTYTGIITHSLS